MNDLKRRVTKLEATGLSAPLVMHFEDSRTRTPLSMSGSAKNVSESCARLKNLRSCAACSMT